MHRFYLVTVMTVLTAAAALANVDEKLHEELDRGLKEAGLTRESLRVDAAQMSLYGGGQHVLPLFETWHANPLRIPYWHRHIRETMLKMAASEKAGSLLLGYTSGLLSRGIRRELIPPTPLQKYRARMKDRPDPLHEAITALDADAEVDEAALKTVPVDVRRLAALLVTVAADSERWRGAALRNVALSPAELLPHLRDLYRREPWKKSDEDTEKKAPKSSEERFKAFTDFYALADNAGAVDYSILYVAAHDLAEAADYVAGELQKRKAPEGERFAFRCRTRMGTIVLSSGSDDTYAADQHYLLILDLSGKDTYRAGGASGDSAAHPVGILIDGAGDDLYEAQKGQDGGHAPQCFGTGVLGYGLLYDLAGNDRYNTPGYGSQGVGVVGFGLLRDFGGDDRYQCMGSTQGAGLFGIGILLDHGGSDTYDCYIQGQGFGFTLGLGLLLDLDGNDRYTANDEDLLFPSAQSKKHNVSLAQGAGDGYRRDYVDGKSLAGGVGMLLDVRGDDSYSGGVFSQAVGYWYGIGILDDRAGNDSYRGVWYAQSATAHFAVSLLCEGGGDDRYKVTNCVSNGAAHDFSVSLFIEEGGNDLYEMPGVVLGAALTQSVALFYELAGDDHYKTGYGGGLGTARNQSKTGWRSGTATVAVFIDLEGKDTYPRGCPGNGGVWVRATDFPNQRGVGIDVGVPESAKEEQPKAKKEKK